VNYQHLLTSSVANTKQTSFENKNSKSPEPFFSHSHTWNILGISLASARITNPCVTDLTWKTLLEIHKEK